MSRDDLLSLARARAFDPVPEHADLARLHVPFDELVGVPETESPLVETFGACERAAVMGHAGAGKSSLIAFALANLDKRYAPIPVSIAAESDETVSRTEEFSRHLIAAVSAYASATQRRSQAAEMKLLGRSEGGDAMEAARQVLEMIHANGSLPIVVIEDADEWLATTGGKDRAHLVALFFGRIVRMLSGFNCGLVLPVDEAFRAMPEELAMAGLLETMVTVPRLTSNAAIERILEQRALEHGVEGARGTLWDEDAIAELALRYRRARGGSVRDLLLVAQTALHHACARGAEIITGKLVEVAVADWPH